MNRRTMTVLMAVGMIAGACSDDGITPHPETAASCIGCHTDYEVLAAIATPDSVIPTGGCSGPPPYVEPHDRVYMDGPGLEEFQASVHGELGCTACHNGVDGTADKAEAHSGEFVGKPSHDNLGVCAGCHASIVDGFDKTLHYGGWGQKRSQVIRAGVASFSELPQGIQHGYERNCASCHASCGECHVNKPAAIGGGLAEGHSFHLPDMRQNCTACHSSRGGHAYYGEGTGTKPDVHLTKAGFDCMTCHTKHELHGDGEQYEFRYQVADLPQCEDCHTDIDNSNLFHGIHMDEMNCHTCHSQDYNTCGSCHVGGEGARVHSHQSFKIALNPLPDVKPYKYSTVRRTLAAPDSWAVFGIDALASFADKPTYNYTTPHNILRWTERTEVAEGQPCYSNCHLIKDADGTFRNQHLYLFRGDLGLEPWMVEPNASLFVDGHLPAVWGNTQ